MRAIALTSVAYDPEAARNFGGHKSVFTTTSHYVPAPFQRNMIKGLNFDKFIIPPENDAYVERLMNREKKDEEYRSHFVVELDEDSEEDSDY